ncbi:DNA mismatch repair protein MSH2, partial [Fasciolopsis buskii]
DFSYPYISLKKSNVDFLRFFLLKRQYRVEIYCASTKSGRDNDWILKLKASPGNLSSLDDLLLDSTNSVESTWLSALNLKYTQDGLLANLETAFVQLESRECLVPSGLLSPVDEQQSKGSKTGDTFVAEHLGLIFERVGVLMTEAKKSDFSANDVAQELKYLLRRRSKDHTLGAVCPAPVMESKGVLACLGAIIKYLDLKADDSNAASFSLEWLNLDNFVRLDSAATRALHLLPGLDDSKGYHVFLTDERLDMVESFVDDTGVRQTLHDDFLRRVPDLQRLTRKLQRKRGCGLQDVYRIYQLLTRLPSAISLLLQCTGPHGCVISVTLVEPLQESLRNFAKFQEMVESTLDLDAVQRRNEYIIRADFDESLGELKAKLDGIEEEIEDEFRRSASKLNMDPGKSLKLDSNDQLGYFMRVTLKDEKVLREFKSFEILDTQKAGVRFRNAAMSRLNDTHMETKREYEDAQKSIVDEVIRIASGYVEPMLELNATIALLDVLVGLAVAAVSAPGQQYVRPRILPRSSGRIVFRQARHPCLEMQESASVIPNDVYLERGKQIFQIITGPNMGGKSTYIRSVGVIAAMAQIGSFVPCEFAELIPVDAIMARVGAADCQLRGVSTFLAEMLETSSVLRAATANSLVIIDELGRGTSTYDGFGLAWAVASHLAGPEVGCFSLFATHFHELTSLAQHMPGRVTNLRVMASVNQAEGSDGGTTDAPGVVMLYKVESGVCNRSYGLDVARIAGLPGEVIRNAEAKARRDEQLETIWLRLDNEAFVETTDNNPSKRVCYDPCIKKEVCSNAVKVADDIRSEVLRILEQSLRDASLSDVDCFQRQLSEETKNAITNLSKTAGFPSDLLLSA